MTASQHRWVTAAAHLVSRQPAEDREPGAPESLLMRRHEPEADT
ncbi:hypothetical protein [Nonomuraea sp. NPDC049504]